MLHNHAELETSLRSFHLQSFHDGDAAAEPGEWHWHFAVPGPACPQPMPQQSGSELLNLACAVASVQASPVMMEFVSLPTASGRGTDAAVIAAQPETVPAQVSRSFLHSLAQSAPHCALIGVAIV
ncbi:MAG: hypothetical protein KDA85_14360 [Planctomycetaceae bacterium]|nr:hypothetical protein [Planctomycetaceae bacterium]